MILYKYFNPKCVHDLLCKNLIRASPVSAFNDPFELCPVISMSSDKSLLEASFDNYLQDQYAEQAPAIQSAETYDQFRERNLINRDAYIEHLTSNAPNLISAFSKRIEDRFHKNIGIISFSENASSLLMWAHYADAHQGFLVEFDNDKLDLQATCLIDDAPPDFKRIMYLPRRPQLIVPNPKADDDLYSKSTEWDYEKEWRVILRLEDAVDVRVCEHDTLHLFLFSPQSIRSVSLGCRASNRLLDHAITYLSDPQYSHVSLCRLSIHSEEYKFDKYVIKEPYKPIMRSQGDR